jgi:hypothetical protein
LALSIVLQLLHRKIEVKSQTELFFAAAISSGEEAVIPTTLYPLLSILFSCSILPFHFDQHALNHNVINEPQEILFKVRTVFSIVKS